MRETMRLEDLIKLVADIGYADSARGFEKGMSLGNHADSAFQQTYYRMRNEGDIYAAIGDLLTHLHEVIGKQQEQILHVATMLPNPVFVTAAVKKDEMSP